MSKGREAGGWPRTVHTAKSEEDVEDFVLKGWAAGNASQPAAGLHRNQIFPSPHPSVLTEAQEVLSNSRFNLTRIFRGSSIGSLESSLLTRAALVG